MGQLSTKRENLKPEDGDLVHIHYRAIRENGVIFENTFNSKMPYILLVGSSNYSDWFNSLLKRLSLNEIRTVVINTENVQPQNIKFPIILYTNEFITIEIELIKIIKKQKFKDESFRPLL